ncbi:PadR family transcriptional regulator [Ktedonosporobacter rubrisoli]|uniref:PadR family transcriptional regulator n=1 Tax=Ktedonosporobacter rubrisoli TaxID=2509675 RepID=A0A4P6JVA9_KTERU|nr:helix-turn-helix transcriptional regulator [Ktedonosporobacter rubrisoli]QBD79303.1 PadR family transcriptional regulator [Ktedonosporobacter rubrisoli]
MRKSQLDLGRFSDPSLLILSSLAAGPKHGYAMMEDIYLFSGTRLEPGTLYGAIARLEQRGWIEALESEDRRRPYRITPAGVAFLREQLTSWQRVIATGLQRLPASS